MNNEQKLTIVNEALLFHVERLESTIMHWKAEVDKSKQEDASALREEREEAADRREELDDLCGKIEEMGALIPVNTGGTMERDPCDAILYVIERQLRAAAASNHEAAPALNPHPQKSPGRTKQPG